MTEAAMQKLLRPELIYEKNSRIYRSWNGLILKRQLEVGKAQQEFAATQLARFLLPGQLGVPHTYGVIGDEIYVAEEVGEPFDRRNFDQVRKAAEYLATLHSIDLNQVGLRDELRRGHFDTYQGQNLRERLKRERRNVRRTFAGYSIGAQLDSYAQLVSTTLDLRSFDEDIVLGHGDFKRANLRTRSGEIVPVDWVDFGLCDRAYKVMSFIKWISKKHREPALALYTAATGAVPEVIWSRGYAVTGILEIGSMARMLQLGALTPTDSIARFLTVLDRVLPECVTGAGAE